MNKSPTILVVDDEPDLCEILEFYLQDAGFSVVTAHSGAAALEIVKSQTIDALITDVRMQNGNGIELLVEAKKISVDRPVVLLISAYADITVDAAYDLGAEVLLSKPVDGDSLVALVRGLLSEDTARLRAQGPRVAVDGSTSFELEDQDFEAKVTNIGRGGMFVGQRDGVLPRVGSVIKFRSRLPAPMPSIIEGSGVVRWIREDESDVGPRGFGMQFVELSASSRKAIAEHTNQLRIANFIPNKLRKNDAT